MTKLASELSAHYYKFYKLSDLNIANQNNIQMVKI